MTLALPLPPDEVARQLRNLDFVLRTNPCLDFERLLAMPGDSWRIAGYNESNERRFDTVVRRVPGDAAGFALRYEAGIKRETRFALAPDPNGSVLTITEVYATPAGEGREERLAEIDRSLVPWAAALRTHLLRRARWGGLPGYRWLAERFWLGMPPRQRRVAWLIMWATALEFLVFLGVLAAYVAA